MGPHPTDVFEVARFRNCSLDEAWVRIHRGIEKQRKQQHAIDREWEQVCRASKTKQKKKKKKTTSETKPYYYTAPPVTEPQRSRRDEYVYVPLIFQH